MNKIEIYDYIYEMEQINALIGFIQIAFAEGEGAADMTEASDALYYIYKKQIELFKRMKEALKEVQRHE